MISAHFEPGHARTSRSATSCSVRRLGVPSPHSASKTRVNALKAGEGQGEGWPRTPHSVVTRQQRQRAKSLRRAMTRAETLLWRYVKAGPLDGLSFRRQTPIGSYIMDFVCLAARVVIEIDGETHDFEERQRRDAKRDQWLRSRGYLVLRFTNNDVLSSLEGVLLTIRDAARARLRDTSLRARSSRPPPSLSLPRLKRVHARLRRAMGGGNPQTTN